MINGWPEEREGGESISMGGGWGFSEFHILSVGSSFFVGIWSVGIGGK